MGNVVTETKRAPTGVDTAISSLDTWSTPTTALCSATTSGLIARSKPRSGEVATLWEPEGGKGDATSCSREGGHESHDGSARGF
jgi:hypothetical protein